MGYYTRYELETDDDHGTHECPTCGHSMEIDHEQAIGDAYYGGYPPFEEETKWYEHEENMLDYSKKYPDVLFTLQGEGEESGDIWTKYFKNGQVQVEKAKVQIAGFDPSKLK